MKNFDEHRALAKETQRVRASLDALADLCESHPRSAFQQPPAPIEQDDADSFEGFGEDQHEAQVSVKPSSLDIEKRTIEPDSAVNPAASYGTAADSDTVWFDDPETNSTQSNHDSHSSDYDSRMSEHSSDDTDLFASQTSDDDTLNPPQIEQNTLSCGGQPADANNPTGESINDVLEQFEW